MVRKACRTYSQIEKEFQKLEGREAWARTFYEPLTGEEEAGGGRPPRHRYADQLDWNDDITTMMSIDNVEANRTRSRRHSKSARGGSAGRPTSAPPGTTATSVALQVCGQHHGAVGW